MYDASLIQFRDEPRMRKYNQQLDVLMQKAGHFRVYCGYALRIKHPRYNEHYNQADRICGELIKLAEK